MKIAFLLRYWPYYGGGETVTRVLTEEFLRHSVEVHIVYWWRRDEGRAFSPMGAYYEYQIPVKMGESYNPDGDMSWVPARLSEYVNSNNIDIVINQWWPVELFDKKTSSKVIRCWHTFVIPKINYNGNILKNIIKVLLRRFRVRRFVSLCEDPFYKESDAMVFLANVYVDEYKKYSSIYPLPNKMICAVHNPLTYREGHIIDLSEKKKEIIFVGRIEESVKRISRILYSWQLVQKVGFEDWSLKIIGDGPDMGALTSLCEKLSIRNVQFTGAKDPRDDYKTASVLLLTSAMEGWPMTIIEGKSYGVVPVIMNTFSAANEVVQNGTDGIVCNSTNIHNFATVLMDIMNDEATRLRYALAAIEDSKKYHVSKIVDQWMLLFKDLLKL